MEMRSTLLGTMTKLRQDQTQALISLFLVDYEELSYSRLLTLIFSNVHHNPGCLSVKSFFIFFFLELLSPSEAVSGTSSL